MLVHRPFSNNTPKTIQDQTILLTGPTQHTIEQIQSWSNTFTPSSFPLIDCLPMQPQPIFSIRWSTPQTIPTHFQLGQFDCKAFVKNDFCKLLTLPIMPSQKPKKDVTQVQKDFVLIQSRAFEQKKSNAAQAKHHAKKTLPKIMDAIQGAIKLAPAGAQTFLKKLTKGGWYLVKYIGPAIEIIDACVTTKYVVDAHRVLKNESFRRELKHARRDYDCLLTTTSQMLFALSIKAYDAYRRLHTVWVQQQSNIHHRLIGLREFITQCVLELQLSKDTRSAFFLEACLDAISGFLMPGVACVFSALRFFLQIELDFQVQKLVAVIVLFKKHMLSLTFYAQHFHLSSDYHPTNHTDIINGLCDYEEELKQMRNQLSMRVLDNCGVTRSHHMQNLFQDVFADVWTHLCKACSALWDLMSLGAEKMIDGVVAFIDDPQAALKSFGEASVRVMKNCLLGCKTLLADVIENTKVHREQIWKAIGVVLHMTKNALVYSVKTGYALCKKAFDQLNDWIHHPCKLYKSIKDCTLKVTHHVIDAVVIVGEIVIAISKTLGSLLVQNPTNVTQMIANIPYAVQFVQENVPQHVLEALYPSLMIGYRVAVVSGIFVGFTPLIGVGYVAHKLLTRKNNND